MASLPAAALLPAAGRSRRMGRPKLLLPYAGTSVVGAVVATLQAAGVKDLMLVLRRDDEALQRWAETHHVPVCINPRPERGMLSSIQEGLSALGGAELLASRGATLLVWPADLPAIRPRTVSILLEAMADARTLLAVPTYQGRRGHPLAVAAELAGEIPRLDPEVGLRQLLDRHAEVLLQVPVDDPGILQDLDTPADYEELQQP